MVNTALIKAFEHVKEFFPTLEIVVFNRYGQWCYMDGNFNSFNFSEVEIDDNLLEEASDFVYDEFPLPFVYQPEIISEELSFDFENDFKYTHKNVLGSEVDYLFESGIFLFWVSTDNGVVSGVSGTRRTELESWADNDETSHYNISDEAFAVHENDGIILNKHYLKKIQELVDKEK